MSNTEVEKILGEMDDINVERIKLLKKQLNELENKNKEFERKIEKLQKQTEKNTQAIAAFLLSTESYENEFDDVEDDEFIAN